MRWAWDLFENKINLPDFEKKILSYPSIEKNQNDNSVFSHLLKKPDFQIKVLFLVAAKIYLYMYKHVRIILYLCGEKNLI